MSRKINLKRGGGEGREVVRKDAGKTRGPAAGPRKIPSFAEPEPHPWDNLVSASPEAACLLHAFDSLKSHVVPMPLHSIQLECHRVLQALEELSQVPLFPIDG